MSLLTWTTKSTRKLAGALAAMGHQVSDRTVAGMLRDMGFSLQGNAKVTEGREHEDRDAQFDYLNTMVAEHAAAGQPVISVDTKKKELVGASRTTDASTNRPVNPNVFRSTTSPTRTSAKRSPTASTTSRPTPAGSRLASTTTPPRSPSKHCAAGGTPSDVTATRTRTGC